MAYNYVNLGIVLYKLGRHKEALFYFNKSLDLNIKLENEYGISYAYGNIGRVLFDIKDFDGALKHIGQGLHYEKRNNQLTNSAVSYNMLAQCYISLNKWNIALLYNDSTLQICDKSDRLSTILAESYITRGNIYEGLQNIKQAENCFNKAVELAKENGSELNEMKGYLALTELNMDKAHFSELETFLLRSYHLTRINLWHEEQLKVVTLLAKVFMKSGKYKKASDWLLIENQLKDSINKSTKEADLLIFQTKLEFSKVEEERRLAQMEKDSINRLRLEREKNTKKLFVYGSVVLLLTIIILARLYYVKRIHIKITLKQKKQIEENRAIIIEQRDELSSHKIQLEKKNKRIEDSLLYAKNIQGAVLPPFSLEQYGFQEFFILNKPRDIVSGDFYWISKVENKIVIVVADCTGHGVPGALLSMLGVSFLNQIVKTEKNTKPSVIIDKLKFKLNSLSLLHPSEEMYDGMDLSICVINEDFSSLEFSGVCMPLYYYFNGELKKLVANYTSLGISFYDTTEIKSYEVKIQRGDCLYMLSDGYIDQFGGDEGKKYGSKRLDCFLQEIKEYSMVEQKNALDNNIIEWQGNHRQIDDILIVGIRI